MSPDPWLLVKILATGSMAGLGAWGWGQGPLEPGRAAAWILAGYSWGLGALPARLGALELGARSLGLGGLILGAGIKELAA